MGVNRPQALSGVWMPRAIGAPPAITGTSGVWTDVTPSGISLAAGYSQTIIPGQNDDNYGVQDILADPRYPGHFYAFVCYQGCWRSTDYGLTWTKVSGNDITYLDGGKNWGSAIAPDGSYMLNTCGNNAQGSPEGRMTVMRSADNGVTWSKSASFSSDPYNVAICPFDKNKALVAIHDSNHVWESTDAGITWVDKGTVNAAINNSGYVFYLHDADTALYVGTDGENTYRGTKSGGTWTWSQVTDLNNAGHFHGTSQLFHDVTNGAFFHAAGANAGADGIYKSTNNGTNWTRVFSTNGETSLIGTDSTLYAMYAAPLNGGSQDPKFTTAARNPGTSWAAPSSPGMVNGAKRMAVGTDGIKWVVLAGCWHAGIWRYVE